MTNAPEFFAVGRVVGEGDFSAGADELMLPLVLDDGGRCVGFSVVTGLFLFRFFNIGFGEALRLENGTQIRIDLSILEPQGLAAVLVECCHELNIDPIEMEEQ